MRVIAGILAACAVCLVAPGIGAQETDTPADENERRVQDRLAEKTQLEKELALLRAQVKNLTEALAYVENEVIVLRSGAAAGHESGRSVGRADTQAETQRGGVGIVDVNRDLRMVVLGAGYADDIRPGMLFAVKRNKNTIARIRVVDVRERVSGAVVDELNLGLFPQADDRLIRVAEGRKGK